VDPDLLAAIRGYLVRDFDPERRTAMLAASGEDPALLADAAELGWPALVVPEEHGGLGLHPASLVPVFEEFGRRLVTGPMLEHLLVPGLLLRMGPGADGAASRLAAVVAGEARVAVADPGITQDWQGQNGALRVVGERLHGRLELVRFGTAANEFVVVADAGGETALALVAAGESGVAVTDRPSGDPGAGYARVAFDDVAAAVLLRGASAAAAVESLRAWQRVLIAAELTGIARHLLDLSLDYIKQRQQFDRSIASFQAVRHIAASAAQRVLQLESFCAAVAADAPNLTVSELALAALTLKATAAESARSVCEDALQLHGGIGFTHEYELHWYYKRALALRAWYGDERELSIQVGRRRLSA
jgi:alkylation response protein AidB-like acyl-CoA dehydrogenase